jgi:CTP synthase (UTP-ammonia lyase)
MRAPLRVALVGDHDPAVTAHRAIPPALARAAAALGIEVSPEWLGTGTLAAGPTAALAAAAGIWCVPNSPYESEAGALRAIRQAREQGVPFLGTCAGFQHALLEYARTMWGLAGAAHAESEPGAAEAVISPLACGLVEEPGEVDLVPGSRLAEAYGTLRAREMYHCNYGLNPRYAARLASGPLSATARDAAGEVRGIELAGHPFFVATLFQPERAGLEGKAHPVITAFLAAVKAHAGAAPAGPRHPALPQGEP